MEDNTARTQKSQSQIGIPIIFGFVSKNWVLTPICLPCWQGHWWLVCSTSEVKHWTDNFKLIGWRKHYISWYRGLLWCLKVLEATELSNMTFFFTTNMWKGCTFLSGVFCLYPPCNLQFRAKDMTTPAASSWSWDVKPQAESFGLSRWPKMRFFWRMSKCAYDMHIYVLCV